MSLVFHAVWGAGPRLLLWAEDATRPAQAPPRRGRPTARPRPRRHPFAASVDELRDALEAHGVEAVEAVDATLVLPGSERGPDASPRLLRAEESAAAVGGEPLPWRVPALAVLPDAAVDLLPMLADAGGQGSAVGDSVRFLALVVELGLELAARGRVLPALRTTGAGVEARWQPVFAAADAERLRALACSMPGIVGAAARPDRGALLREIVDAITDAIVRSSPVGTALAPPPRRGRRPVGAPSVAELFAGALGRADPSVPGDAGELAKLAAVLDEWRQSAALARTPVRVCFRLDPPSEDADLWRLELLLQPADDPSLLVPATEVWDDGPGRRALAATVAHPQELLLEGLGRASRLYPELERALAEARPGRLELDTAGAVDFLRHAAPLLEQTGFGVLVPPWWASARARLGARLRAKTKRSASPGSGAGRFGMDALVDYRWEVALGDHTLTHAELVELARLKQPLVRVRGEWVELREDDLAAALALLEAPADRRQMQAGDVLRTALGLTPVSGGLPVVGVEADGWLGDLLGGADRRLEAVPTPAGFDGELRPYQQRGLAWLTFLGELGLGACLADDMGLGKTAQLLASLVAEREARPRGRSRKPRTAPTLVVCPMSVVGNWQREAARFAPGLRVHVHHGAERLSGDAFAEEAGAADLVLTTYNLVARDQEALAAVEWGRLVLDEAQNVKNSDARQTRAVRALSARRRVALTGTPVENRLTELWSIMEFLNPGMLGSERAFRERFALPIERYGDDDAAEVLRRVTGPFVLRRLKTDKAIIADLPDKLEMKVFCNLTREQATLYQAVVDDMLARIEESEGMERRGLVLATMLKLKQVCNHPAQLLRDGSRLDGRSGKLARVEEVLEEVVAEGDRALVFTQFAEMGTMLHAHLQERLGREVSWLHGGTPKRVRDEMVARFQGDDGPSVFILSIKAGGTGLNLTAANHVVHFDRWWNPAVEDQATDRAFRIGQRRDVQVRKLVCVGTLEERIDAMIEDKRALAERIVGTGEGWLTELSTDALREIVALSADAVAEG